MTKRESPQMGAFFYTAVVGIAGGLGEGTAGGLAGGVAGVSGGVSVGVVGVSGNLAVSTGGLSWGDPDAVSNSGITNLPWSSNFPTIAYG